MLSHSIAMAFGGVLAALVVLSTMVFVFVYVSNFLETRSIRRGTYTGYATSVWDQSS